jgi:hypothetical protein
MSFGLKQVHWVRSEIKYVNTENFELLGEVKNMALCEQA